MDREIRKPIILVDDEGVQTKAYYMDELERNNRLFIAVAIDPAKTATLEDGIQMAIFRVDTDEETGNNILAALDPGEELNILQEIFYYRIQKVFEMSPDGEFPFEFDISDDEDLSEEEESVDEEEITIDEENDKEYNEYTDKIGNEKQRSKTSNSDKGTDKDLSSLLDEIDNI